MVSTRKKNQLQDKDAPSDGSATGGRRRAGDPLAGAFIRTNVPDVDYGFMVHTLAYAIRRAQLPIHDWHFRTLGPEFRGGKMVALVVVGANEGLRQRDLADILGLAHSAVVGLIDRFAEMGLVERRGVPSDRRAYELALTKAGRAKVEEFEEIARAHDQALSALITPEERKTLLRLLDRIAKSGSDDLPAPTLRQSRNGRQAAPTGEPERA